MDLKNIYKIDENSSNNKFKNIEHFADEVTGYCEDKWGDNYVNKTPSERLKHCKNKCNNKIRDSYTKKMTSDGRTFEDCMLVGNECIYNFSMTNEELSAIGGSENELEEKETYESYDRTIDLKQDTERENQKKIKETDNKGIEVMAEMTKNSQKIINEVDITKNVATKEIVEKKNAVKYGIQSSIDDIFGGAFSGDWKNKEKFSSIMNDNAHNNYVVIFIIIVFLAYLIEKILLIFNSKKIY